MINKTTVGYLGPNGTYTEKATNLLNLNATKIPYNTIYDILKAVDTDDISMGVVPIQNTIEGVVNATMDALIFDFDLYIQKQIVLPISHNLMISKHNKDKCITKILSHPQALGQCRRFINDNFKNVELIEVSSTSKAAKIVSKSKDTIAAIGNDLCIALYDLDIINEDIQDNKNNKTYFFLISKNNTSKPTCANKLSVSFSTYDKPGALYKILDIFSIWDLNITQISSRPMKNIEGEYMFYIEIEDFTNIKDLEDCLRMIERKTNLFKNLGCYDIVR